MSEPKFRVQSFGGGKQSTVILLMAHRGEIERPDYAIFADTGWEPQSVYAHIAWLETFVSIPIIRVGIGRHLGEDIAQWVQNDGKPTKIVIPVFIRNPDGTKGMMQIRQCTTKYKIGPIEQYIRRNLLNVAAGRRVPKGVFVEQWIGISTDEIRRMKPSFNKWQVNRWPLIELGMSRQDCVDWFAQYYPGRQLPRSACSGCPFRSDREWLNLKQSDPEDFAEAARIDDSMREMRHQRNFRGKPYLHGRLIPVEEAVAEYEEELRMNPMLPGLESGADNECEGVCFT